MCVVFQTTAPKDWDNKSKTRDSVFTSLRNRWKLVKNIPLCVVFLSLFSMFWNVMRHSVSFSMYITSSAMKNRPLDKPVTWPCQSLKIAVEPNGCQKLKDCDEISKIENLRWLICILKKRYEIVSSFRCKFKDELLHVFFRSKNLESV